MQCPRGRNVLTSVASVALALYGIGVVGIGPGTILTDMGKESIFTSEGSRQTVLPRTLAGLCSELLGIPSVASFLARTDAADITGQTIYPDDGGWWIFNYAIPVEDNPSC